MPTISEFYGIKIYIFYDDHAEPHFHVYYGEDKAEISVKSAEIISGKVSPRVLRMVKEWMKNHKKELFENWKLAEEHKKLKDIAPLD